MHGFNLRPFYRSFVTFVLVVGMCLPYGSLAYADPDLSGGGGANPAGANGPSASGLSFGPPTGADFEAWEADGTLEERLAFQESLNNDQVSEELISQALQPDTPRRYGTAYPQDHLPSNEHTYMGMSTTGNAHVVALYVNFPAEEDGTVHKFVDGDSREALQNLIGAPLGEGRTTTAENPNSSFAPYDSLNAYYQRSSYGDLSIDGTAFEYIADHPRSYYNEDNIHSLFAEALTELDKSVDFSAYDGNDDNLIDAVYLHFAGGNTGWGSTWWSNKTTYKGAALDLDGMGIKGIVTLHLPSNTEEGVRTAIHETGHLLGLPDYYSYYSTSVKSDPSDRTGILTFDMMNNNIGDHNAFSKWMLGWIDDEKITRIVVNSEGAFVKHGNGDVEEVAANSDGETSVNATLNLLATDDVSKCGGFIAISDDKQLFESDGLFSSFYLLEYNSSAGNQDVNFHENWNDTSPLPTGFRLFRVQAELDENGTQFAHANKTDDVHDQFIELVDLDASEWHYAFSGSADSTVTPEYDCMMTKGDAVTPEGYPSTNFFENINTGFTGISIKVTESSSTQGAVKVSYSNTLKPNLAPDSLTFSLSEDRGVMSTDVVDLVGNMAIAGYSYAKQPYIVVDDTCVTASAAVDGSIVTVSYSMPPELFVPGESCEVVFPTGSFLIGIQDGEEIYSGEVRVSLPIGNVAEFESEGFYEEAFSNARAKSNVFDLEDGSAHFIVRDKDADGNFLKLCTVDPNDPTKVTARRIDGLCDGNAYVLEVVPMQDDEFCLLQQNSQYRTILWVSADEAKVKAQAVAPRDDYAAIGSAGDSLLIATMETDYETWQQRLIIQAYSPLGDGNADETGMWIITGARGAVSVNGTPGLMSILGMDPSTGSQAAFLVDLASLLEMEDGVLPLAALPAVGQLDISDFTGGLLAVTITSDGYVGAACEAPETFGSPDLESDGAVASEGGSATNTTLEWRGSDLYKSYLVAFDRHGDVTESNCIITHGNGNVIFNKIAVSDSGAIAAEMTLDPNRETESRLVMFFEDGIASKPATLSNGSSGSGVWLKDGSWLETDWDYLSIFLFAEGEQFDEPSQAPQEVHFLITKAFADDEENESEDPGNNGNGGGNAGGVDEGAEGVLPGSESNGGLSTVAETGDSVGILFWITFVLASVGVIAACISGRRRLLLS